MTKLILSTSNIMGGAPSLIRSAAIEKSNAELTNSLRANFKSAQSTAGQLTNGASSTPPKPSLSAWTTTKRSTAPPSKDDPAEPSSSDSESTTLYIPSPAHSYSPLAEERAAYDITLKLFYLPDIPAAARGAHTREAVDLVLRQLGVQNVDLLIASFPGISFDADDEESDSEEDEVSPAESPEAGDADDVEEMLEGYRTLEQLAGEGVIGTLGVAEFGTQRLGRFLEKVKRRPTVNQINVKDCCVVPKPLILFAKREGVQLLTHSDCTNILPKETLGELLGEVGVTGKGVRPLWVVKYTAVVKDQGVVENKGYFAVAELDS